MLRREAGASFRSFIILSTVRPKRGYTLIVLDNLMSANRRGVHVKHGQTYLSYGIRIKAARSHADSDSNNIPQRIYITVYIIGLLIRSTFASSYPNI